MKLEGFGSLELWDWPKIIDKERTPNFPRDRGTLLIPVVMGKKVHYWKAL